jgi:glyoxylase-like metal-dependent hydrolase (beta-lactamase superfamily II)
VSALPVALEWFERRTFADGVTLLSEPYVDPFARCNVWHVRGRDRDLVIDTGLGLRSLRDAARDLFERPVTAVLTHAHFDHTGGAYEFAERLGHPSERDEHASPSGFYGLVASAFGDDVVRCLRSAGYALPEELLTALPEPGFSLTDYRPPSAPLTGTIEEGDVVDLGDRVFEVLELPGHSPGSIGLYERSTRTLFSGDAVYDGPLLYELPGSSTESYARTLRRLLSLDVNVVHAGHDPSFGSARLRAIAEEYLRRFGEGPG